MRSNLGSSDIRRRVRLGRIALYALGFYFVLAACSTDEDSNSLGGISVETPPTNSVIVTLEGNGTGRVEEDTQEPTKAINCPGKCEEKVKKITLRAIAAPRNLFDGWTGACASAGTAATCSVTVADKDVTVGARFVTNPGLPAATITWDGNIDGDGDNLNWDDPRNWDLDRVPSVNDDVIINTGAIVEHNVDGVSAIKSIVNKGDLTITYGTISPGDNSVNSGTVTLATDLFRGPDKAAFEVATNLEIRGELVIQDGVLKGGGAVDVVSGGKLTLSTGASKRIQAVSLDIAGLVELDGTICMTSGASLHVAQQGVIEAPQANFNCGFEPGNVTANGSIHNEGLIRSTSSMIIGVDFDNAGVVEFSSLELGGRGTHSGTFVPVAQAFTRSIDVTCCEDQTLSQLFQPGSSVDASAFNVLGNVVVNGDFDVDQVTVMGQYGFLAFQKQATVAPIDVLDVFDQAWVSWFTEGVFTVRLTQLVNSVFNLGIATEVRVEERLEVNGSRLSNGTIVVRAPNGASFTAGLVLEGDALGPVELRSVDLLLDGDGVWVGDVDGGNGGSFTILGVLRIQEPNDHLFAGDALGGTPLDLIVDGANASITKLNASLGTSTIRACYDFRNGGQTINQLGSGPINLTMVC